MCDPLVSVLMTAFNREYFIKEAIESVLASTYKNFELIVVDDCSIDGTINIAKKFANSDSRVRVYVNNFNLGDYRNRNLAASYALGKYLKYLDSDDTMSPFCLERMVEEMENHPNCAFGISSKSQMFTSVHFPSESFRVHFFERGILDNSPSSSIIRTDIFRTEGGFLELRCVSDFELWMRLALKYPLLEVEKGLIFWRQHDNQEIRLGRDEYLKHNLRIIEEKVAKCVLSEVEKKSIISRYRKALSRFLIKNCFDIGMSKSLNYFKLNKLRVINLI